jgi:hypothetical protein
LPGIDGNGVCLTSAGRTYYDDDTNMEDEYDYGYEHAEVGHHLSWTSIGLIIIVMIVMAVASKWLYNRKKAILFFLGKPKPKKDKPKQTKPKQTKPENIELIEIVGDAEKKENQKP